MKQLKLFHISEDLLLTLLTDFISEKNLIKVSINIKCMRLIRHKIKATFTVNIIFKNNVLYISKLFPLTSSLNITDIMFKDEVNRNFDTFKDFRLLKNLTKLHIFNSFQFDDELIEYLFRNLHSNFLKTIKISTVNDITDNVIKFFADIKSLTEIDITDSVITDVGLKYLSELPILSKIYLYGSYDITNIGLSYLSNCKFLTIFRIYGCDKITDEGIEHFLNLKLLTELDFSGCKNITDIGLLHLSKLKNLTILHVYKCNLITNTGLLYLSNYTLKNIKLSVLTISNCNLITDVGIKYLLNCKLLKDLCINNCYKITNTTLKYLSELELLSELNISGCKDITDIGLKYFISKPLKLSRININGCEKITDIGIKYINLDLVMSVNFSNCNITDSTIKYLEKSKLLKAIFIKNCYNITNDGIKYLSKLKFLFKLDIAGCNITNKGIEYFLTGEPLILTSLNICGCSNITIKKIKYLKKIIKNVIV